MKIQIFLNSVLTLVVTTFMMSSCTESLFEDVQKNYFIAQLDDTGVYNIIDEKGDIASTLTFDNYVIFSNISSKGAFWVEDYNSKTYKLYNVKSGSNPSCDINFNEVTEFNSGVALASVKGEPINLINETGKIISVLSKDIVCAKQFSNGLARVCNVEGKWGYINTSGEIVIDFKYADCGDFCEEMAVVLVDEGKDFDVIDKIGNVLFSLDSKKYYVRKSEFPSFSEGLIKMRENTKSIEEGYFFINGVGEIVLELPKLRYERVGDVKGGLIEYVIYDRRSSREYTGIVDINGRIIIRPGEYLHVENAGNGKIIFGEFESLRSMPKFRVIDNIGEFIINDDKIFGIETVGDNFLAQNQDQKILLFNSDGREIFSRAYNKIVNQRIYKPVEVSYFNQKIIAEQYIKNISAKGYTPLNGMTNLGEIVKKMKIKTNDTDCKFLRLKSYKIGEREVEVRAFFDNYSYNFSSNNWYSDATLTSIGLYLGYSKNDEINGKKLKQDIIDILTKRGFTLDSDNQTLNATIDGKNVRARIYQAIKQSGFGEENSTCVMLWPNLTNGKTSPFEDAWFFHMK